MKMGIIRVTMLALISALISFHAGRVYEYAQGIEHRAVYESVNEIALALQGNGIAGLE